MLLARDGNYIRRLDAFGKAVPYRHADVSRLYHGNIVFVVADSNRFCCTRVFLQKLYSGSIIRLDILNLDAVWP